MYKSTPSNQPHAAVACAPSKTKKPCECGGNVKPPSPHPLPLLQYLPASGGKVPSNPNTSGFAASPFKTGVRDAIPPTAAGAVSTNSCRGSTAGTDAIIDCEDNSNCTADDDGFAAKTVTVPEECDESSECAHVSISEVACCRLRDEHTGGLRRPPYKCRGDGAPPAVPLS